jgi:hypothetical protein
MVQAVFEFLVWVSAELLFDRIVSKGRIVPKSDDGSEDIVGNSRYPISDSRYHEFRSWTEDPVYKKNLQRLIERNRQFEEERNERHS